MQTPDFASLPPGFSSWEEVMGLALEQACLAGQSGEVPVGAVALDFQGHILARCGNASISMNDPTAHAELLAIRRAAAVKGNYRLTDVLLAVTLEPCMMCLGAMIHARIAGLIFGARDPRAGVVVSRRKLSEQRFLNHSFPVQCDVLGKECAKLLSDFFQLKRTGRKA